MAANTKRNSILGDGNPHGLAGGTAVVATPSPRQGEHAFDAAGRCPCGAQRKLVAGAVLYLDKHGLGWTRWASRCTAVWQ